MCGEIWLPSRVHDCSCLVLKYTAAKFSQKKKTKKNKTKRWSDVY